MKIILKQKKFEINSCSNASNSLNYEFHKNKNEQIPMKKMTNKEDIDMNDDRYVTNFENINTVN